MAVNRLRSGSSDRPMRLFLVLVFAVMVACSSPTGDTTDGADESPQPTDAAATSDGDESVDVALTAELQNYLKTNFGDPGVPWYDAIEDAHVRGATVQAVAAPASAATGVCAGLSGFAVIEDLDRIIVYDADGDVLRERNATGKGPYEEC